MKVYPELPPMQAISDLFQAGINYQNADKKVVVAALYQVLGYTLGQTIGEPPQMVKETPESAQLKAMLTSKMDEMKGALNKDWEIVLGGILATLTAWYMSKLKPTPMPFPIPTPAGS